MGRRLVFHIVSSFALIGSPAAALAADFDCSIADPQGDANVSSGQGFVGAPYQDIVRSGISRTGSVISFSMDVAAAIPAGPELKNPNGRILWMWGISTGPDAPQGYPLAPGVAGALEFWVDVSWDGTSFSAEFVDRRPSLLGGEPTITAVPFSIQGTHVSVTVDSSLLGDPPSFNWGSSTWAWPSHLGTTGPHKLDAAPIGASTCP